ncbi:hypothetical protein K438DRAFT_1942110 [Mycena galopus ATCC 62051]|nr:hypothetical protein K438DRAFT_1942110 [Mycena galopus ATCC 62051]
MATIYTQGIAPIVTVYGPGNLHHLTYMMEGACAGTMLGIIPTTNEGTTNFLLGFSQFYGGYAFYWDGAGETFWRAGNSTVREPVGTTASWANATSVPWKEPFSSGVNVAAQAAAAGNAGQDITSYYVGIVTVRPGGRTVQKTAVQWTVLRRYGSRGFLITLDGTGR